MIRISQCTLGLLLCLSGLAIGQQVTTEQPAPGTTENRLVSQILGSTVQLNDGTGYGRVQDIVLGPENQVEYLVVAHGNQYAMFPWTAGQFDPRQRVIAYAVAPQIIQPMLFAPTAWPNTMDPAFARRMQTVFPQARLGRGIRRDALRPVPPAAPGAAPDAERPQTKRNTERPGVTNPIAPAAPAEVSTPNPAPAPAGVPPVEKAKPKR
jgi:sporulation protein YlmC with PRC-barrel domain